MGDNATAEAAEGPGVMTEGEFSVCQFFEDGSYEYVRRSV
jgi:hypothetical protein